MADYVRQGSIDDENFLYLADKIDGGNDSINTIGEEISTKLQNIKDSIDGLNISEEIVKDIKEKLTEIDDDIEQLNSDLSADTLLWQVTESEWTSGEQTIDLDLSGWRYVRVVWSQNSSTTTTGRHAIIAVGNSVDVQFPLNFGSSSTANPAIVNKAISVSSTGVTGDQSVHVTLGTSGTTVNRESPYLGIKAVWGVI